MKIIQITHERSASMGNFETARFSVTAEISEGEDVDTAMRKIRTYVGECIKREVAENSNIKRGPKGERI